VATARPIEWAPPPASVKPITCQARPSLGSQADVRSPVQGGSPRAASGREATSPQHRAQALQASPLRVATSAGTLCSSVGVPHSPSQPSTPAELSPVSRPLLFPLLDLTWSEEARKHSHEDEELPCESACIFKDKLQACLSERLSQAERGLAEKDRRIERLEACTARLAERLALAEGLSHKEKEPSTPGSTRSTSDSTAWTNSELASAMGRMRTEHSLTSFGSLTAPATPQAQTRGSQHSPSMAKRHQAPRCLRSSSSSAYASAADVDQVCRRSELLLKAMTAAVANGDRPVLPRRSQVKSPSRKGHSENRIDSPKGETRSSRPRQCKKLS